MRSKAMKSKNMPNCLDQALEIGIAVSTIKAIKFWRLGIAYDWIRRKDKGIFKTGAAIQCTRVFSGFTARTPAGGGRGKLELSKNAKIKWPLLTWL